MRPRSALFPFQANKMAPRIKDDPCVAAFVGIGYGKTGGTLTALVDMGMPKTLVVAPKRVAKRVWNAEAAIWEHTKSVRVNSLLGDGYATLPPDKRLIRLMHKSDIDVISYDLFKWLTEQVNVNKYYQAIVWDELDKMKTPSAGWFKAMRYHTEEIPIRIGLTGEPTGNSYRNLWGEMFAVAKDKPLGPRFVDFLMTYFTAYPVAENVKAWALNYGAAEKILSRIKPWAFSIDSKDAPPLPPVQVNPIYIDLPKYVKDLSAELARELRVWMKSGVELEALSTSTLATKVRQMAGGAVYIDLAKGFGPWEEVHTEKLDALEDIVDELQGKPVLVFYWFKHELARLLKRFPQARVIKGKLEEDEWNAGKIEIGLMHPASAGHGLNLQFGGFNQVWYTLPWSWIFYSQANGRLPRPGQLSPFVMSHCLLAGDADTAILEALRGFQRASELAKEYVKL